MSLAAFGSLAICLEIELLNRRAGGILPRGLPSGGNPKWRILYLPERQLTEKYERQYRFENTLVIDKPLPKDAAEKIKAIVAIEAPQHYAEARLRNAVEFWGLLQYPLSLLLMVSGTLHAGGAKTWQGRVAWFTIAAVGCVCLGMALHRAYFSSLGY